MVQTDNKIDRNQLYYLLEIINTHIAFHKNSSVNYTESLRNIGWAFISTHEIPAEITQSVNTEITEISLLLNNLFQINKAQNAYTKAFSNTNDNFNRILRNFQQYKKSYTDVSERILNRLTSVEQIQNIIGQMKVIAKEIKLFSINSIIIASQAGKQGVGFKSISRFIIELSDTIQKSAAQLESYSERIFHIHENLKNQFDQLIVGIYGEKITEIQNKTRNSVIWAAEDMEVIMKTIQELAKRIQRVLDKAHADAAPYIEGKNRLLDVHIIQIALGAFDDFDIKKGNLEDDETEMLKIIAAIKYIEKHSEKNFRDALSIVTQYRAKIMDNYRGFLNDFGATQQDQMYFYNYLVSSIGGEPSLLDQIFSGIKKNIVNFQSLLKEEAIVKETLNESFLEIEKIHQEGLSIFTNFEKFFTTMNNINVLTQIEISKNTFETFNNANLKQKFTNMLNNIKKFNNDIKNNIKKMLANLIVEMDKFSDLQIKQNSLLRNTDAFLDQEINAMDFSISALTKQLNTIRDENPKIFNVESSSKQKIDRIDRGSLEFVESIRVIAQTLKQNIASIDELVEHTHFNLTPYYKDNHYIDNYMMKYTRIMREISPYAVDIKSEVS